MRVSSLIKFDLTKFYSSVKIFHCFLAFKAGECEQHPCKNLASELIIADVSASTLSHSFSRHSAIARDVLLAVASLTKQKIVMHSFASELLCVAHIKLYQQS